MWIVVPVAAGVARARRLGVLYALRCRSPARSARRSSADGPVHRVRGHAAADGQAARVTDEYPKEKRPKPRALPRPSRPQPLRGRHGEVHRLRAVRGRVPGASASTCAAPTTRSTTRSRRASATASSTRSTTCAASTATCASRRARPRRSPRRSSSSSRSRNRADAIYTKDELLVGDDGRAQRLPWELWLGGEDDDTSAWMRATSPSGARGVRRPRRLVGRARLRRPRPSREQASAPEAAGPSLMARGGDLLRAGGRGARRRARRRARAQPGALGAVPRCSRS